MDRPRALRIKKRESERAPTKTSLSMNVSALRCGWTGGRRIAISVCQGRDRLCLFREYDSDSMTSSPDVSIRLTETAISPWKLLRIRTNPPWPLSLRVLQSDQHGAMEPWSRTLEKSDHGSIVHWIYSRLPHTFSPILQSTVSARIYYSPSSI